MSFILARKIRRIPNFELSLKFRYRNDIIRFLLLLKVVRLLEKFNLEHQNETCLEVIVWQIPERNTWLDEARHKKLPKVTLVSCVHSIFNTQMYLIHET